MIAYMLSILSAKRFTNPGYDIVVGASFPLSLETERLRPVLATLPSTCGDVLLPARLPGVRIDAVVELSEVQDMLAERVLEWTREWKQQGLDEGRKEGESLMLQRLLTAKFGPLDAATQARLAAADSETLLVWGERVLAAGSLTAVFDGTPGP
jgi:hypothetical protein